ncbi:hypothetical protein HK097_005285 [Rhizophlyctis rosea]|uniref:glutamate-5-semialdehyde dehydrogenase n=1 Tax=Rhizophlyctis rosea TaxID=64517 RepID=A0AAD5SF58_9FUNG|nr:hypothetical protein HK097_005285 [Rhizophlyctis rosea]
MTTTDETTVLAQKAKTASHVLQTASPAQKSAALRRIQELLAERKEAVLAANKLDLESAEKEVKAGRLSSSLYKRLDLSTGDKYNALLEGVLDVDRLPDPTGQITLSTKLDNDLDLYRVTCPVGVLLIIFEARPEVVVQISCLAIKSGNAVILKGGKEATHSNRALFEVLQEALRTTTPADLALPAESVQLVSSRDEIATLLKLDQFIDLAIPRGSKQLVQYVQSSTRIPVLGHADGLCSVYVDESAHVDKAVSVTVDSKINYPAACNAAETLLVNSNVLSTILPAIARGLIEKGVSLRADERSLSAITSALSESERTKVTAAKEEDFDTEFLELTMAVKTVDSLQEAVTHINTHGSHHTDAIVTEDEESANFFMGRVDAAGTYWNASTRFADGFRYGFGAEIGVSTNKTHARGPVGLEGLVLYKYRLYGKGQGAGMYGEGKRKYLHEQISVEEARKRVAQ